ncbi:Calcium/proton exchanger [Amanita rubescens]|nr:Calcium/proton exchanger [Amanita rubescens]
MHWIVWSRKSLALNEANNMSTDNLQVGGPSLDRVERNTQLRQPKAAQRRVTVKEGGGRNLAGEGPVSFQVTSPKGPRFTLQRAATMMLTPTRPVGRAPGFLASLLAVAKSSWLNLMLVFIPVSWALHFALPSSFQNKDTLVFVFSFLAIIPLAKLLAFTTDEISIRVGETLAGLINVTLGNAVKLIVAIIALIKCEFRIVQSSLVGSILSNLLLVLGMSFFAGGLKFSEQGFGISATRVNSSLLIISVIAGILPAAFQSFDRGNSSIEQQDILSVSRGVSVILLFIYCAYLIFQLYSHTILYDGNTDTFQSTKYHLKKKDKGENQPSGDATQSAVASSEEVSSHAGHRDEEQRDESEDEDETPEMNFLAALFWLAVVTALVAVTAEWLVDSINGLTTSGKIQQEFVGLILLPVVANAAEHVTAVTVSDNDKLNLSLGVAVGSCIQIALFIIPFIVVLGWILGKPMSLLFDPYESITLFLSVLTVNLVVQDGKSNWLKGVILVCLNVILAITFWYYPGFGQGYSCS